MERRLEASNLIISADDFGLDSLTNERILALAKQKKIDRVAVMIDGAFLPEEIGELSKAGLKLDLHLDIPVKIRPVIQNEVWLRLISFAWFYISGKIGKEKIRIEWKRQLEKFKSVFGRLPDGLNSHQHIHFFPPFFEIFSELASESKIEFVRFGAESIIKNRTAVSLILNCLRNQNLPIFKRSTAVSSDHLVSFDWIKNPQDFLKKIPAGKTEIIFHPKKGKEYSMLLSLKS